ncbi:MAG TPA: glycosyltransferase [Pseudomonadales bacterium]
MKVLFLVQKDQRIILDRLYEAVGEHVDCDLRWLSDDEQANLKQWFRGIDVAAYDRIIFFLRFKKEIKQVRFIRSIPNLVILEHDAYQNYIPGKYQGRFSRHYRALPWARVLCSGVTVSRRLRDEGVDCVFVPKGYDESRLANTQQSRDIELAFVGSTGHRVYQGRKVFLDELAQHEPLQVVRTASGDEYKAMLNRIRFFVSCDMGMGEYMIKNFEAMACGCVLLAYDQGAEENAALGLRDMENIVLYRDIDSLRQKLARLRAEPALADAIAAAGQRLASEQYTFAIVGKKIADALQAPLREHRVTTSFWQRWLPFLG